MPLIALRTIFLVVEGHLDRRWESSSVTLIGVALQDQGSRHFFPSFPRVSFSLPLSELEGSYKYGGRFPEFPSHILLLSFTLQPYFTEKYAKMSKVTE